MMLYGVFLVVIVCPVTCYYETFCSLSVGGALNILALLLHIL